MPYKLPNKKSDTLKEIIDRFLTIYEIFIYDTNIYLKPNPKVKKFLRVFVNEINVKNEAIKKNDGRDLTGRGLKFDTENIYINLLIVKIYGWNQNIFLETEELKIIFNRFLFFDNLKFIMGEKIIEEVFFGNKIDIKSHKV